MTRVSGMRGVRPLLEGRDPLEAARRLLRQRESEYAAASVGVDTDGRTPEDVVEEILDAVRDNNPESVGGRNVRKA